MELSEFITGTLTSIVNGVKNAQEATKGENAMISPPVSWVGDKKAYLTTHQTGKTASIIKFDVSLSVQESKKEGAKAGIFVSFAGASVNHDTTKGSSSLSRIQFEIPVVWPLQK